jgi:L-cystine transport system ATP-binding protein
MIVVTHEMIFAREVSNRVVFMEGGEILAEGTPEELFVDPHQERLRSFLARLTAGHAIGTAAGTPASAPLGANP